MTPSSEKRCPTCGSENPSTVITDTERRAAGCSDPFHDPTPVDDSKTQLYADALVREAKLRGALELAYKRLTLIAPGERQTWANRARAATAVIADALSSPDSEGGDG